MQLIKLKGNSGQNTSVVHMKDLTDFSLLSGSFRVPFNLVKKIPKLENLLNFDAIFVSHMTSFLSPSFSAVALFR